ncbi:MULTISPECIES: chorismate mutase [Brevibacillus]|uniref:chorismate mutase n=1 Tax=Brevibacillus TaxID=55080 RepID=UPI00204107AF|nr:MULTISPECIES: chorismate mutase [Brevibacillus]MCM3077890.1 chorismate mutase [Brevibacillus invocatus]MCM3428036.1 chorismate mutase [Brevibacillus invocatus]MDH4616021.1 chorismate mutase [Brevibacillus sp. AY1]
MGVRGVRGAITVENDTKEEVISATKLMLKEIISRNGLQPEDIASMLFTTTEDVSSVFPAQAARLLDGENWAYVPLMCMREIPVPGSLPMCVRVIMHVNTDKSAKEIQHVFLRDAVKLRPDLTKQS